ncbi:MAG: polysaccharide deacetylase family protein [Rhodoglobus sp.]
MDRRVFLGVLAASAVAALTAGALVGDGFYTPPQITPRGTGGVPRLRPRPVPAGFPVPIRFSPPSLTKIPLPGGGAFFGLPGDGNLLALTVDDGDNSEVVGLYAKFIADTGMRLTFFVNGSRAAWTDNAPALRPLVDNGQVQMGNHTWSHPNLTKLSNAEIVQELQTNEDFIVNTFGLTAKPYFRPPYGYHDDRVDAVAASIGYSTPVMWYGSLADSTELNDGQLMAQANQWILPQHIVIGHANWLTVTRHYDEIVHLIRNRGLVPVTLDDVFLRP